MADLDERVKALARGAALKAAHELRIREKGGDCVLRSLDNCEVESVTLLFQNRIADAIRTALADDRNQKLVDRVNEANDEIFESTVRGNEVLSPEMAEKVKPMLADEMAKNARAALAESDPDEPPAGFTDRILRILERIAEHEQELKASDPAAYERYLKRVGALADLLDAEEQKPARPGWGN